MPNAGGHLLLQVTALPHHRPLTPRLGTVLTHRTHLARLTQTRLTHLTHLHQVLSQTQMDGLTGSPGLQSTSMWLDQAGSAEMAGLSPPMPGNTSLQTTLCSHMDMDMLPVHLSLTQLLVLLARSNHHPIMSWLPYRLPHSDGTTFWRCVLWMALWASS